MVELTNGDPTGDREEGILPQATVPTYLGVHGCSAAKSDVTSSSHCVSLLHSLFRLSRFIEQDDRHSVLAVAYAKSFIS